MTTLAAPPALSTPATHIFEADTSITPFAATKVPRLSDKDLLEIYEIPRTVKEIREGGWRRIALQFPDSMLRNAPRIFEVLSKQLRNISFEDGTLPKDSQGAAYLSILADTSYNPCCVDEVAAEHMSADVLIHYGTACLSPTARLPVVHVFTRQKVDIANVVEGFTKTFPPGQRLKQDRKERVQDDSLQDTQRSRESTKESMEYELKNVVLMADCVYQSHLPDLIIRLRDLGYTSILTTIITHSPNLSAEDSSIPNRQIIDPSTSASVQDIKLRNYTLFHLGTPSPSLALSLSTIFDDLFIYPIAKPSIPNPSLSPTPPSPESLKTQTTHLLRRRYATLLRLTTAPVIGILITSLSLPSSTFLPSLSKIRFLIEQAGKKSYTVVVGKVNIEKLANFGEVGGWVGVGCLEGGDYLLDAEKGFYKPVITPYELGLVLMRDEERIWGGRVWRAGLEGLSLDYPSFIGNGEEKTASESAESKVPDQPDWYRDTPADDDGHQISDEESEPPDFDLRTGRYISQNISRPMKPARKVQPPRCSSPGSSSPFAQIKNEEGDDKALAFSHQAKALAVRSQGPRI